MSKQNLKMRSWLVTPVFMSIAILISCQRDSGCTLEGEFKQWHRISLVFDGPETSETAEVNPFLNYRLDVTFSFEGETYTVPGFFAADGNAAETGATSGNKWIVRFTPGKAGKWRYAVSFKKGDGIAVAETHPESESAGFMDGAKGSFVVAPTDKTGNDSRARGRLEYVGGPYLRYSGTGDYFIKVGVDAPENLLGYTDFDATTDVSGLRKTWEPHRRDVQEDMIPFSWQGGKGMNLMGAIHYLASEGLNAFSFLTFNVDGDDRNVFPHLLKVSAEDYTTYANDHNNVQAWDSMFHRTRFDVSKLEQWERIFEYAETQGMFLHFKTHETETDHLMDGGTFGVEGKLYYRELIARFGHHLAMNWNLGEENNQPIGEVIKAAYYIHDLDPYHHHLVMHTFPNQDDRYAELIGDRSPLTGASLQLSDSAFRDVHQRVLKWRTKSDSTGRPWALALDEPGSARYALLPDEEDPEHNDARINALYGTLMAGGYGVEWYFGYSSPQSDLTCEDFRSRDLFWDQNRYARHFFENYLPFWGMVPADGIIQDPSSFCLALIDSVYAVFLPRASRSVSIHLGDSGHRYSVRWFNPRTGEAMLEGSTTSVIAKGTVHLGDPPAEIDKDWLVVVQRE